MKRIWAVLILLTVLTVLLSARLPEPRQTRGVVVQVDIYSLRNGQMEQLHLTQQAQIEAVLQYLRAVRPPEYSQTVEAPVGGSSFTILVRRADGRQHIYRQRGSRFFCRGCEGWKPIRVQQGQKLSELTEKLAENRW